MIPVWAWRVKSALYEGAWYTVFNAGLLVYWFTGFSCVEHCASIAGVLMLKKAWG